MIFHHLSDQPLAQDSCAGPVMQRTHDERNAHWE